MDRRTGAEVRGTDRLLCAGRRRLRAGADSHEPLDDREADTACNGIAIPDPDATCAVAASGAFALAESGDFGPDDTVVLLNTVAGNKDVDALRAHLGEREANEAE